MKVLLVKIRTILADVGYVMVRSPPYARRDMAAFSVCIFPDIAKVIRTLKSVKESILFPRITMSDVICPLVRGILIVSPVELGCAFTVCGSRALTLSSF